MMKTQSVTEITKKIKSLIENEFYSSLSVSGEISGLSVSPSDHSYFILKDENSKIKAVMFKRFRQMLVGYSPKNGDKVVATGDIRLYEPDGTYQIIVKNIRYDSIGDFYKIFEEVKRKLEAEGLFDVERKKKPVRVIKKIALITSPTGAAIKDFIVTLNNNQIGFKIDLWPVQVQGESAIPGIVQAISYAGKMTDAYDAVVIMRGGGSMEDLSLFNNEFIARALHFSSVPTISAIGHERDVSICDFIADVRVATPTAAAEYLSEGVLTASVDLQRLKSILERYMEISLLKVEQKLDMSISVIERFSPEKHIDFLRQKLESDVFKMINIAHNSIKDVKFLIDKNTFVIKNTNILNRSQSYRLDIDNCLNRISNRAKSVLDSRKNDMTLCISKIAMLNPDLFLDKGYAIVRNNNIPVSGINQIKLDDELEIILKDGYINSFVTGKRKKDC